MLLFGKEGVVNKQSSIGMPLVADEKRGFCIFSSETTLGIFADLAKKDSDDIRFIYCGNTDGVYDANGKTIPEITPRTYQKIKRFITGSGQIDVTGGMLHKVEESLAQARQGIITTPRKRLNYLTPNEAFEKEVNSYEFRKYRKEKETAVALRLGM